MPEPSLKIDNAAFLITVDRERRVVKDGAIVIAGQRITHVGKAAELAAIGAERVIDAHGFVVTPAFVDAHMHISYAHAVRGIFRDDFVGQPRLREVFRLQSEMTAEEEYATSLLAITELMKNGTVTFVDPGSTKFLDACMQAYADSRCRIVTGESVVDLREPLGLPWYTTEEALARTEHKIRTYDHQLEDRLRVWAMPFGNDSSSRGLLVGMKRLADEYGTGVTLHLTSHRTCEPKLATNTEPARLGSSTISECSGRTCSWRTPPASTTMTSSASPPAAAVW